MALLEIRNLSVEFQTRTGAYRAVDELDLSVEEGEVLGIVGESGSGKSVAMLAVMGLIAKPGKVTADIMKFAGQDLLTLSSSRRRRIMGSDMAMIFQEPMTSLNPCFTAGYQITESLAQHRGGAKRENHARTIELMRQVGIPAPEERFHSYPHQLSGGMSQRIMIAMAIACSPRLLIADEPTTALDVTIQAQILDLLRELQHSRGMAMILISHDLAVVSENARRVQVMYAGQAVETGATGDLFNAPRHPYTAGLLASLPERQIAISDGKCARLPTIPGVVPGIADRPKGCLFNPRCSYADTPCRAAVPSLVMQAHRAVRCIHPLTPTGGDQG